MLRNFKPNRVFKIPPARYHPHPSISFLLLKAKIISITPENKKDMLNTKDRAR